MINAQSRFDARALNADNRSLWGWFVVLGIALLLFGFIAFSNLIAATVVSVVVVGAMMTVAAIFQIIQAFRVRDWGGFFFWLLGGILYGIAGLTVFYNPRLAAAILTLVVALSLIASGILRTWLGIRLRHAQSSGWMIASGVITILAGIILAIGWPANTVFLLGLVLAIDLTFQGVSYIGFGLTLKNTR